MIRQDDSVFGPFQRFLQALLQKLLGKQAEEAVLSASGKDAENIFGMPIEVLDTMDVASVSRVIFEPRFLEVYAAVVAASGRYLRARALLEAALAAKHPEPSRMQALIDALGEKA